MRRRICSALMPLGVCWLALAPTPVAAQGAADRAALESFRDSLAATADSAGLLTIEKQLIARAKTDRNNSISHLRLGFLSLRLGELGGHSHYDDAASEFQWAIDLSPAWPYPYYGMGLAEYGVGDSQISFVTGLKAMFGKDALTRSALNFAKSAAVDPAFVRGLVELANTALRQRVNIKLGVALDALRRAASTPAGQNPEVLLARGRVEREAGDADSALVALRGYVEHGDDRSLGLLELARTQFVRGSFDGGTAYFEGAASDDPVTVAGYRADLVPIASDSVLRELDGAHGALRAAYLRTFWSQRDRQELRSEGERLREHYRRLFYARRNFALVGLNRHYDIVERYRSGSRDFDDRGIIYIRQGEPTDRAAYHAPGLEANESWRYARADGDLIFHFIAREDVQDYKLVESVFDVLGFSGSVRLQGEGGVRHSEIAEQLLLSREQLAPIYRKLQGTGTATLGRFQSEERELGHESIAIGTTTDSYELRFPRALKVRSEVLAVGSDSGTHQLQIAYAIAGRGLRPVPVSRGLLYTVRVRFAALDQGGRVVASLDTTRRFMAPQAVPEHEHLVGRVAVAVPAGKLEYRLSIQEGDDAGVVFPRDTVRVGPAGSPLSMSDLVLGSRGANLTWRQSEQDTVYFNPLRTYRRGEPLELYYEIEGLAVGGTYSTQVTVRKGSGGGGFFKKLFGGGPALSLKFSEQAPTPMVRVRRSVQLERLKSGVYALEVLVTDAGGHTDRRVEPFEVVEP